MDMENFAGSWKKFRGFAYTCTNERGSLHLYAYGTCFVGKYFVVYFSTMKILPPPRKIPAIRLYDAKIKPWIIEHRGVDRKRACPTMLNVLRFGNPLKYSGLRAAEICIAQQFFLVPISRKVIRLEPEFLRHLLEVETV